MALIINTLINYFCFNLTFYLSNLLLFIIDFYQLFTKYKIQQIEYSKIMNTYKKVLPTVLKNTLIYTLPIIGLFTYYESNYIGEFDIYKSGVHILVCRVLSEILFYVFHRVLHLDIFYRRYHKKHHEITAPVGLSAVYMTVVDFYFGNIVPLYLPLIMVGVNPWVIKVWIVLITLNTVIFAHSGFKFFADNHDYHHKNFNKNFGTDLFMDRLFGTSV
jgi:sterol desaturase/sphingolipid hydroxylase (fatty acid hydroxylase superfamily)